jgi:hypothetical protein
MQFRDSIYVPYGAPITQKRKSTKPGTCMRRKERAMDSGRESSGLKIERAMNEPWTICAGNVGSVHY